MRRAGLLVWFHRERVLLRLVPGGKGPGTFQLNVLPSNGFLLRGLTARQIRLFSGNTAFPQIFSPLPFWPAPRLALFVP